jgi:CRP/FNR family transcriptional regulator, cyclic AMP receptor protein
MSGALPFSRDRFSARSASERSLRRVYRANFVRARRRFDLRQERADGLLLGERVVGRVMTETQPVEDHNFLGRLNDPERSSIAECSQSRSFERGAVLFRQGDSGSEVFIIRSGRVKVSVRRGGREVILAVYDAGALLGELGAVDGNVRSATVTALEPVDVDAVSHDDFMDLLERHPRVATELLRLVAARLRSTSLRQLEFGTMDALARLCASLSELAARYGTVRNGQVEIVAPFHQGELASWSGISREAVVKGFRQLRGLGWLAVDGRTLILRNPEAIRRRANRS